MDTEDHVDRIRAQWARLRPELDTTPMAVVGRLSRVSGLIDVRLRALFAGYGIGDGDFDVLAALRRAGDPAGLSPGRLQEAMMITSGAVTKRVDRLERAGLVSRTTSAEDGRARVVALSEHGRRPIVLVPRTTYAANSVDLQTAQQLGNGLQQRTGIEVAGACTDCAPLVGYARRQAPHTAVFLGPQGQVLVRFPAALVATPLNDHRPPWWLSPLFFRADD